MVDCNAMRHYGIVSLVKEIVITSKAHTAEMPHATFHHCSHYAGGCVRSADRS